MCATDSEASDHQDRPSCLFVSDLSHCKCVCRKNRMPPRFPLCLWMSSQRQRAAPDGSTEQTGAFGWHAAALLRVLPSAAAEVVQDACIKIMRGHIQINITRSHDLVWKKTKMCLRFVHQLHVMTNHGLKTDSVVHLFDVCPSILSTAVQAGYL